MTRVVLDTNILVSALLQPLGPSAQLFLRCLNGSLQLCLTGSIFAEYEEVISRPRLKRSPDVIAGTLRTIRDIGLWVKPSARVTICSDPDDDVFLEMCSGGQRPLCHHRQYQTFSAIVGGSPRRHAAMVARYALCRERRRRLRFVVPKMCLDPAL